MVERMAMETRTKCDGCGEPSRKVLEVREPDGGVFLLCEICVEAVADTVDILTERR
jgi:hypothetical protein